MKPSEYIYLKSLTLEERLRLSSLGGYKTKIVDFVETPSSAASFSLPIDEPLFKPHTPEIVLQSYTAFETHRVPVTFRNMDTCSRRLRLEPLESNFFKIAGIKSETCLSAKVAAGMEVSFLLEFTPSSDDIDYRAELVCVTEREKFLVPIRAFGSRGLFELADSVKFERGVVRYKNSKIILIQNVGLKSAQAYFKCSSPLFQVCPAQVFLDPMQNAQLEIVLFAEKAGHYNGELIVTYDTGEEVHVDLSGSLFEENLQLETSVLDLKPAFITSATENRIKIINGGNIVSKFKCKFFPNADEEERYRFRQMGKARASRSVVSGTLEDQLVEEKKLENALKLIQESPLLFESEILSVEPLEGTVWPNSSSELQIIFKPNLVGSYSKMIYIEVEGRTERLALTLQGQAKGPQAQFSFDLLDIAEIYINHSYRYEAVLENTGQIDLNYSLIKLTTGFQPKFVVSPASGKLAIGQKHTISIEFNSNQLGEFCEDLLFELISSPNPVVLTVKGKVIGPTFRFNQSSLEFGVVSYGFEHTKTIELTNTSHVSMDYCLRVDETEEDSDSVFEIVASSGTLAPKQMEKILVKFTPYRDGFVSNSLILDVLNVMDDMFRVPIVADVDLPKISVSSSSINFGDCFINYPYQKELLLVNESSCPGKFSIVVQEDSAKNIYRYACSEYEGVIAGNSQKSILVNVEVKRLGKISFPLFIQIKGEDIPFPVDLNAFGKGPSISADVSEVNFGKIRTLTKVTREISLKNISPISAQFLCSFSEDARVFKAEPISGNLEPNSDITIAVSAFLDDSLTFNDVLKISVSSGSMNEIRLVARGIGATVQMVDFDDNTADFGNVMCDTLTERKVIMINKGRRTQYVTWNYENSPKADSQICFDVVPNKFSVKSGQTQIISIQGYSAGPRHSIGLLNCFAHVDRNLSRNPIFTVKAIANFIEPKLVFSCPNLEYRAVSDPNGAVLTQEQSMSIKNVTGLPLHVRFKCDMPFTVPSGGHSLVLDDGQEKKLSVLFHPQHFKTRMQRREVKTLKISYLENKKIDEFPLIGNISFPTLHLETEKIDFGHVETGSVTAMTFRLFNKSDRVVDYEWQHDKCTPGENQIQVWPISGHLLPGESEVVTVTLSSRVDGKVEQSYYCRISGGPEYHVSVHAAASPIMFHVDAETLDFGSLPYNGVSSKRILVQNKGSVPIQYRSLLQSDLNKRVVVSPSTKLIPENSSLEIHVGFCPRKSGIAEEQFLLKLGNKSVTTIKLKALGTVLIPDIDLPSRIIGGQVAQVDEKRARMEAVALKLAAITNRELNLNQSDVKAPDEIIMENFERQISELSEKFEAQFGKEDETFLGSAFLHHHVLASSKKKPAKNGAKFVLISELSNFALREYVCDFENVFLGEGTEKSIRIPGLDQRAIRYHKDAGFDEAFEISGVETKTEADGHFQLLLRPAAKKTGTFCKSFSMDIPGGARLFIRCMVNVIVPELRLSTESVNFDSIFIGQRKTLHVSIVNDHSIPCSWKIEKIKKPDVRSGPKDFVLSQRSGIVAGHGNSRIAIVFEPEEARAYSGQFAVATSLSKAYFSATGTGKQLKLEVLPDTMEFSCVLPYSETVERKFTVKNLNDFPVDLYLPEFDSGYAEELKTVQMQESLYSAFPKFRRNIMMAENAPPVLIFPSGPSDFSEKSAFLVGDAVAQLPSKPFFVIFGPPCSGKTSLATLVAQKLKVPSFNLEALTLQALRHRHNISTAEHQDKLPSDEESIAIVVKRELSSAMDKGFVVDGLGFRENVLAMMKLIVEVLGSEHSCFVCVLDVDLLTARERSVVRDREEKTTLEALKGCIKDLDEDIYDQLPEEFRKIVDHTVQATKKRRVPKKVTAVDEATETDKKGKKDKRKKLVKAAKTMVSIDRISSSSSTMHLKDLPQEEMAASSMLETPLTETVDALFDTYSAQLETLFALKRDSKSAKNSGLLETSLKKKPNKLHRTSSFSAEHGYLHQTEIGHKISEAGAAVTLVDVNAEAPLTEVFNQVSGFLVSKFPACEPATVQATTAKPEEQPELTEQKLEYKFIVRQLQPQKNFSLELDELPDTDRLNQSGFLKSGSIRSSSMLKLADEEKEKPCKACLASQEKRQFTVKFLPSKIGVFQHEVKLDAVGYSVDRSLTLKASIAVPEVFYVIPEIVPITKSTRNANAGIDFRLTGLKDNTLDFGILFTKKTKDKAPPAHRIKIPVRNESKFESRLSVTMRTDTKSDCFTVEVPTIDVPPGESRTIDLLALPIYSNKYEDTLIICTKDNPAVKTLKISARGIVPDIEWKPKNFNFDKIIIGRTATKEITLTNKTSERLFWRLVFEHSMDYFEFSATSGRLLGERTEVIKLSFSSPKIQVVKKSFKIEYSDDESFQDSILSEAISVVAEAYDILLDIHFPKGSDNGIDFGMTKIWEESKHVCHIKNKGKHDAVYKFTAIKNAELISFFPETAVIGATEKPHIVSIYYKSDKKIQLNEEPCFKIDIVEPVTNEVIRAPVIKVSAQTEYSAFQVGPSKEIKFGQLTLGSKQHRQLQITNEGHFELFFTVIKASDAVAPVPVVMPPPKQRGFSLKSQASSISVMTASSVIPPATTPATVVPKLHKKAESFSVGPFTISPGSGTVAVGGKCMITVEMRADSTTHFEETIDFEVAEKDPEMDGTVVITGEVVMPKNR